MSQKKHVHVTGKTANTTTNTATHQTAGTTAQQRTANHTTTQQEPNSQVSVCHGGNCRTPTFGWVVSAPSSCLSRWSSPRKENQTIVCISFEGHMENPIGHCVRDPSNQTELSHDSGGGIHLQMSDPVGPILTNAGSPETLSLHPSFHPSASHR